MMIGTEEIEKDKVILQSSNDSAEDLVLDISLKDVDFSYGKGSNSVHVLKDISMQIHGPQLVSIVGPNGVGKSTLIHLINKILVPSEGTVFIGDKEVSEYSIKDLAKIIGYVPCTSSDSFPLTVADTVLMGRFPHSSWGSNERDLEIVEKTLQLLDIEDLALRPFNELSAGQHQKVMLARGLAQEPKILLLDEPTSNLDIKYQMEITRILRDLAHQNKIIVVMISHDINIASRYSDNIIMLKNGGIYAVGRPIDVITSDNVRNVYDIGCNVIVDNGHPHVILIDDKDTEESYSEEHYVLGPERS